MERPNHTEPEAKSTEPVVQTTDVANDASTKRSKTQPSRRKKTLFVIFVIVAALLAGFVGTRIDDMTETNNNEVASRPAVENDGNMMVTQEEESIASVVSKVSPSVVSIVTQTQSSSFYGPTQQEGAGTGMIISEDGYILTNKHVVNDAGTVDVVLTDGTSYDNVRVVGTDPLNDVAIVKIADVSGLPAVELGDSSSVRVGQRVIAIGNSLGQYQNTVTSGIISGTGRPVSAQAGDSIENLTDLLQTDAAINPGNSGGPLLNFEGQVIGINTAIIEDAQGIGFAIPINATKGIIKGVLADGDFERAYVGLNYIPITAEAAKNYNLPVKQGAYVFNESSRTAVINGSPADKAGIREKDIITKVNGLEIGAQGGLSSLVAEYAPGDTVELTVLRDGETVSVKVTLEAYRS